MRPYQLTRAVVLAVLLGCSEPGPPIFPTSVVATDVSFAPRPEAGIVAAADSIQIVGLIGLNVPCYRFAARAELQVDTIVVTLVATERDVMCLQYVTTYSYLITIHAVPPGRHPLQLFIERYGHPTRREFVRDTVVFLP